LPVQRLLAIGRKENGSFIEITNIFVPNLQNFHLLPDVDTPIVNHPVAITLLLRMMSDGSCHHIVAMKNPPQLLLKDVAVNIRESGARSLIFAIICKTNICSIRLVRSSSNESKIKF
jgi:hypothetical protein